MTNHSQQNRRRGVGGWTLRALRNVIYSAVGTVCLIAIFWGMSWCITTAENTVKSYTTKDGLNLALSQQIVNATNHRRTKYGLPALPVDPALTRAAQRHSAWMGKTSQYGHAGEGGSRPWQRALQAGYDSKQVAENIAMYPKWGSWPDSEEAVTGWMNSPGHRANILDGSFTHIGVGAYRHNGTIYLTQNFGWRQRKR